MGRKKTYLSRSKGTKSITLRRSPGDKLTRAVTVKRELQKLINAVREKFKLLRQNEAEMRDSAEVGARRFVEPLQRAVKDSIRSFVPIKTEVKTEMKPAANEEGGEEDVMDKRIDTSTQTEKVSLTQKYIDRLSEPLYKDKLDFVYGVRPDGHGGMFIGDSRVNFTDSTVSVKNKTFNVTRGLLELMFMKTPNRLLFSHSDLQTYKEILLLTNAHLHSYSAEKTINSNRGKKYTSVISPMFYTKTRPSTTPTRPTGTENIVLGSGVYNDNVNTLVNRLRLLVMSRSAGHTGHDIEISSIINTLRVNNIIT